MKNEKYKIFQIMREQKALMKKLRILCFIFPKDFSQSQCGLKHEPLFLIGVQSKTKFNKSNFMRSWEDALNKKFNLVI